MSRRKTWHRLSLSMRLPYKLTCQAPAKKSLAAGFLPSASPLCSPPVRMRRAHVRGDAIMIRLMIHHVSCAPIWKLLLTRQTTRLMKSSNKPIRYSFSTNQNSPEGNIEQAKVN